MKTDTDYMMEIVAAFISRGAPVSEELFTEARAVVMSVYLELGEDIERGIRRYSEIWKTEIEKEERDDLVQFIMKDKLGDLLSKKREGIV